MKATNDRRNPYLVLGIAYGSSIRDVKRAFAKRAKKIGSGIITTYIMEDLNWALYQLEQSLIDPDIDVTIYRVPANPSVLYTESNKPQGSDFSIHPMSESIEKLSSVDLGGTEDSIDAVLISWIEKYVSSADNLVCIPYPFPK